MPKLSILEFGGCEGPKSGNALQEVCVHEVGNRGGFVWARRWNYIICFCFFVLGAGLVLGREPPRVCLAVDGRACLDAPHTPTSSYHPKSVLIGIGIYIYNCSPLSISQ